MAGTEGDRHPCAGTPGGIAPGGGYGGEPKAADTEGGGSRLVATGAPGASCGRQGQQGPMALGRRPGAGAKESPAVSSRALFSACG